MSDNLGVVGWMGCSGLDGRTVREEGRGGDVGVRKRLTILV